MKRILKPTGSIYLHCDPTAGHYLKMLMDGIFGRKNFRNEIIWSYKRVSNARSKKFLRAHDTILFYTKTDRYAHTPLFEKTVSRRKQQLIDSGYNTKNMDGKRYLYVYDERKVKGLEARGRLNRKDFDVVRYPDTTRGNRFTDVFSINFLNPRSAEHTGYPTQKPLALLDRIILSSSNPGDVVFDPFCGCATAMVSADGLDRDWIGVDLSPVAVDLVLKRIRDQQGLFEKIIARDDIPRRTDCGEELTVTQMRKFKRELYGLQCGHCGMCKNHHQIDIFDIDHIVPKSKGGTSHKENLQLLCPPCNSRKGTKTMAEAMAELRRDQISTEWLKRVSVTSIGIH